MEYTNDMRENDIQYAERIKNDLFEKHGEKYIVIRKERIQGVFDSEAEAIDRTIYERSSYIIMYAG